MQEHDLDGYWNGIAAAIVQRGLRPYTAEADLSPTDRLLNTVPGYSSATLKRRIRRSVRDEVSSMWPGLNVDVTLRDDSTAANLVDQIAAHVADWLGE
jgi:hypothetical protein